MTGEKLLLRRRAEIPFVNSRGLSQRFLRRRSAQTGILLAAALCVAAIFGAAVWRVPPERMNLAAKLAPPSLHHPLGTDQFGRDQLARILDGGRRSLGAAVIVLAGVLLVSLTVGVAAGMAGGLFEQFVLRLLDVLLALPALVLALAVVGVLGAGYGNLLLALVASLWAYYARLARSYVRLARQRPDVITARLADIGWWRVTTGHIVPGVSAQLVIVATLDLGGLIIWIAGLSFLGLGVQPPDAEWGAMLAESRLYFTVAPWLLVAPAAAIFLTVVSANLIATRCAMRRRENDRAGVALRARDHHLSQRPLRGARRESGDRAGRMPGAGRRIGMRQDDAGAGGAGAIARGHTDHRLDPRGRDGDRRRGGADFASLARARRRADCPRSVCRVQSAGARLRPRRRSVARARAASRRPEDH